MKGIPQIHISEYDYPLDSDRIAKFPLPNRDMSKLLVYSNGSIEHILFKEILTLLRDKDLIFFNNTKVIRARLVFKKLTGAAIEVFLLEPISPIDYGQSFGSTGKCIWKCIVGNLKRWKGETLEMQIVGTSIDLKAKRIGDQGDGVQVEFSWDDSDLTFAKIIELCGAVPIPPYLNRKSEESDKVNYQTVYAKPEGSVAAPTAGLHFTPKLLDKLNDLDVNYGYITLHVGAGTFKPVKNESIAEHNMHTEHFFINSEILSRIRESRGRIISVGTTTLRALESIYWLGVKLRMGILDRNNPFVGQWDPYRLNGSISVSEALNEVEKWLADMEKNVMSASTQLCIVPGYDFKIVDTLITNYHQPRSTLLLLVAAFVGDDWKSIYNYALENDFRFLSYGDSSILFKKS